MNSAFIHLLECATLCNLTRYPYVFSLLHADCHVMEVHNRQNKPIYNFFARRMDRNPYWDCDYKAKKFVYHPENLFLDVRAPVGVTYRMSYRNAERFYYETFKMNRGRIGGYRANQVWAESIDTFAPYRQLDARRRLSVTPRQVSR